MIKIYKEGSHQALEYLLIWQWNNDEYYQDALDRAVVVAALKLAFWRKYPYLRRMPLMMTISGMWYELRAFISYERGKFFSNFEKRALCKLGCSKIFMELDYDRLKSL